MKNREIGIFGEKITRDYLKIKGFQIIEANFKTKFGEIDIIEKSKEGILVFVEVKTLLVIEGSALLPEDNFTTQKFNKVKRMAEFFSRQYPEFINEEYGWRIDLVVVELSQNKEFLIRHYENV